MPNAVRSLGPALLALAILHSAAAAEPAATTGRTRAKAVEAECRRSCSAWIVSQCDAQSLAPRESVLQCAGRLAPVFQTCVDRCRGR